jgi:pyruvate dehydrogenase E1 component
VDRHFAVVAAIKALADENKVASTKVADAIKKYDINPDKPNPATAGPGSASSWQQEQSWS